MRERGVFFTDTEADTGQGSYDRGGGRDSQAIAKVKRGFLRGAGDQG